MDAIIKFRETASPNLGMMFSFMQTVLGELQWKIIKMKENSVFLGVPLIFHFPYIKKYLVNYFWQH